MSASDQRRALARGDVTPSGLRDAGIARCEAMNPRLGFLVSALYERAPGGVPILLKDAGQELAGTPHWAGLASLRDAACMSTSTTRLAARLEQLGFSIIGKSACPPMASGVTTEPEGFPPTRNPWDLASSAGGSSGGAAVAVACGAVPIAHGSDATGSLRFPAALCGLVTLVPSAGLIESATPCGQPPNMVWRDFFLARDARDLTLMFELLVGPAHARLPKESLRVGVLDHDPELGLEVHPACQRAVHVVATALQDIGAQVNLIWPTALDTLWQRAGTSLSVSIDTTRPPTLRWVSDRLGRPVTKDDVPVDVFEAARRDATRTPAARADAWSTIDETVRPIAAWWDTHDLLVTPATFQPGWPLGGQPGLTECGTLAAPFSLTGQPSIVVPVIEHDDRAPVGVQIVGPPHGDQLLLRLAEVLQSRLDWLHRAPRVFVS